MNSARKANILVIIVIALIGLGASNVVASFTGDYVKNYINLNAVDFNETSKMIIVEDGQFNPATIDDKQIIYVPPVNNTTINDTNTTGNNVSNNDSNNTHWKLLFSGRMIMQMLIKDSHNTYSIFNKIIYQQSAYILKA